MKRWWLPVVLGGALVLTASVALASPRRVPAPTGNWKDGGAPERIRRYAGRIEEALGWPRLADYLVAVAYWESRGISSAVGGTSDDPSGGWFQLTNAPACVRFTGMGADDPAFLADEALQVAVAACHARRLGILYDEPGQTVQWRDIRRGWKFPKWTGASYRTAKSTAGARANFLEALEAVGLPASLATRRAFPSNLDVPEIDELLAIAEGASS